MSARRPAAAGRGKRKAPKILRFRVLFDGSRQFGYSASLFSAGATCEDCARRRVLQRIPPQDGSQHRGRPSADASVTPCSVSHRVSCEHAAVCNLSAGRFPESSSSILPPAAPRSFSLTLKTKNALANGEGADSKKKHHPLGGVSFWSC